MFLLKGHEDLTQHERVMQLSGLVNTLLNNDPETFERHLRYKCMRFAYVVIVAMPSKLCVNLIFHHFTLLFLSPTILLLVTFHRSLFLHYIWPTPNSIECYSVIPLSPNSGLIGWMPHCDTIHTFTDPRLPRPEDHAQHRAQVDVTGRCNSLHSYSLLKRLW